MEKIKQPDECHSKMEVRQEIDKLDKQIIELFAKRFEFVKAIVKFKTDTKSIMAKNRKDEVIKKRGEWALNLGMDQEIFESIYRDLINHNIQKELEILENKK